MHNAAATPANEPAAATKPADSTAAAHASSSHLVLIPSYNTGRALLRQTVAGALRRWSPVWVVIDGSTDGSDDELESLPAEIAQEYAQAKIGAAKADTAAVKTALTNTPEATASATVSVAASPTASTPVPTSTSATVTTTATAPATASATLQPAPSQIIPVTSNGLPTLHIIRLPKNGGKGRAVYAGMQAALQAGFTHALCFDADGQHPADAIPTMMALSTATPQTTIMGQPIFGSDAPAERLFGRKIANFFTEWEAGHCGLGDTLFGMRVYRIAPTLAAMDSTGFARRFDFDPEVAVRLCWQGVQPVPCPVPCRYLSREEGGVSHFNYLRDNIFQILLHLRLLPQYLLYRWLPMRRHKRQWQQKTKSAGK